MWHMCIIMMNGIRAGAKPFDPQMGDIPFYGMAFGGHASMERWIDSLMHSGRHHRIHTEKECWHDHMRFGMIMYWVISSAPHVMATIHRSVERHRPE